LNLAMFFGYHVLWPQGFTGGFDMPSALIALAAAVIVFKYRRSVIQVVVLSGLAGIIIKLILAH